MIFRYSDSDFPFDSDFSPDNLEMFRVFQDVLENRTRIIAEFGNEELERPLAEMNETEFLQDFGYLMNYFDDQRNQENQENQENPFQQYTNNNSELPQSGIHKACIIPLRVTSNITLLL